MARNREVIKPWRSPEFTCLEMRFVMKGLQGCFNGAILYLVFTVSVCAQSVPFDSGRWEIKASENRVEDFLGRKSLLLKGGLAWVKDSVFTDGIIEFDIAFSGER